MTHGVTMKNMSPLSRPAAFNSRSMPEPKMPAKPVPEPKKPTTVEGKPLQKPRVVDSPRAEPTPKRIEERRAMKKEALLVLKVAAKAMMMKAEAIIKEFTNIRCMCKIFMKYFALHSLVALLKTIKHLLE